MKRLLVILFLFFCNVHVNSFSQGLPGKKILPKANKINKPKDPIMFYIVLNGRDTVSFNRFRKVDVTNSVYGSFDKKGNKIRLNFYDNNKNILGLQLFNKSTRLDTLDVIDPIAAISTREIVATYHCSVQQSSVPDSAALQRHPALLKFMYKNQLR